MNKIVYFELEGKKHPLVFTYAVSEYIDQNFDGYQGFSEALKGKKTTSLAADMFCMLNAQGCAYYKLKNQDMPEDESIDLTPIKREELVVLLSPLEAGNLIHVVDEAFKKAIEPEIEGTEKKTKNAESA